MTTTTATAPSAVHSPPHYQGQGGIEAIDVIEAVFGLEGHAPNALKYMLRHRAKGRPAEDLAKARWYVARLLGAPDRPQPQPLMSVARMHTVVQAFALGERVRDAFAHLLTAVAAVAGDRYRAELRACCASLDGAIADIERGRA